MATNYSHEIHNLWELGDDAKLAKIVQANIDMIREDEGGVFKTFKKGPPLEHPKQKWLESNAYQTWITGTLSTATITFSGYLLGEAIDADAMRGHIWVNQTIERESDRLQMKVTAVDYDNLQATVAAHGNGTLSNDSAAATYKILAPISYAYDDTYRPGALDRFYRYCGAQTIKTFVEMSYDTERTKYEQVANELTYQLNEKSKQMYQFIRNACLRMEPVYSGGAYVYGDASEGSAVTGFLQWPKLLQAEHANTSVYVNKSSVALTEEDINGVIYSLELDEWADFNRKGWTIACHPLQRRYMKLFDYGFRERPMDSNKTGYSVDEFEADNGKVFKVITDPHYPKGVVTIHNPETVSWGYYKNYQIMMERLAIDATDVTKKKLTCKIWGTMFRNPRQNIGMIYGLPTTFSA